MDLSEFKRMEQTEKDLRISLEKEEELRKEIQKLQKEKLEALEASKMKVSKVQTIKRETIIRTFNPLNGTIDSHKIREIRDLFRVVNSAMFCEYSNSSNEMAYALNELARVVFKVENLETEDTTATLHGLDEVKVEIREQLKNEMDEETKTKLKAAEDTLKIKNRLLPENKELRAEITALKDLTSKQLKEIDRLKEEKVYTYEQLITKNEELGKLVVLFRTESTLFNKGKIIKEAKNILFKKSDQE